MNMSWLSDIELLRAYMRAGIMAVFMAGMWHVMHNYITPGVQDISNVLGYMEHLNTDEKARAFNLLEMATKNSIPAGTVWSWFTGVVTGTLIIYYFGEKATSKTGD